MDLRPPALLTLLLAAAAAGAHHSIASIYDGYRQITLEGVITEFRFVNPHPRILVRVSAVGAEQAWTFEMDNRWELAELGFEPETLRPGDRIVVTGNPGRVDAATLYVRRLERPADGFSYDHHPTNLR